MTSSEILDRLFAVIESRRGVDPKSSYTAKLLSDGRSRIARKLGEEAIEAVIAATEGDKAALTAESADVLYHLLVAWADAGIAPNDIWAELARREGVSGIDEKNSRNV
ncbi:MAG: phosphoribosyl-ATP diphosphatase [Rhodospirillales bacterium]|nr:phosphoribosyl-ATP diphosphatase [Rhodospirillales bacterium]